MTELDSSAECRNNETAVINPNWQVSALSLEATHLFCEVYLLYPCTGNSNVSGLCDAGSVAGILIGNPASKWVSWYSYSSA